MLKDFAEAAVKLARNPLGIIGLAFVLVYGIAGVVATSAVFGPQERLVLVWFLVGFPVLILGSVSGRHLTSGWSGPVGKRVPNTVLRRRRPLSRSVR